MVFEAVGVLALAIFLFEFGGALQHVVQFRWCEIQQRQKMSYSHDGGAAGLGGATLPGVGFELCSAAAELFY
jgi:hypothetical protein